MNDISAVLTVDNVSSLKDVFGRIDNVGDLWEKGKADPSLTWYLPGGNKVLRQKQIFNIFPRKHKHHQFILIENIWI